MAEKKEKKWRKRFRISILNESTLNEVWHVRMSMAGALTVFSFLFLLTFALLALLIWFTPLRNYLPGYDENIRRELVTEIERVDSLQHHLTLQSEYLTEVRNIMAGEVSTDSVMPLDSLSIIEKEKLLEEKSVLMQQFIEEQEAKGRDNLSLFASTEVQTTPLFFRPVNGKNVAAVLSGTVVAVMPSLDGHWSVMVQHADGYLSQSGNLQRVLKHIGDQVGVGETIGIIEDPQTFSFSLLHNGKRIDYENISNTR